MNCKWAESELSAYFDGMLDSTTREKVERHIEQCANCSGLLAEYRYFDGLLRNMPRYQPSANVRERIFDSPEYAEILSSLEDGEPAPASRWPVLSRPGIRPRAPRADDAPPAGHDRPLEPLPIPLPAASLAPAGVGRLQSSAPPWARVAAAVAAALVVLAGSALLLKQGLMHPTTANRTGISSVAGQWNPAPLAAGPRVVYSRDGALWSAPQHGAGMAQQLTPPGVVVGDGWAVTPLRDGSGGDAIAYIDQATGALHVVRSNDQRDHVVALGARLVAQSTLATIWGTPEGQAILGGLVWSPDGSQIAYLSDPSATGLATLRVARTDNTHAAVAISPSAAGASLAAWSPDGTRVAWVQTEAAGQSVWDYNLTTNQVRRLGAVGRDASATARALAWLGADQGPAVTWAAVDPVSNVVTGVYVSQVLQGTDPRQLTASGQTFTTAAFSVASGGLWLLSDGSATYAVAPLAGTLAPVASLPGGATAIAWSPGGTLAAMLSATGDLRVWARGGHSALVASGVSLGVPLAWAPDDSALGFVSNGQLVLAHLAAGVPSGVTLVASLTAVTSIAWSPDATTFVAGGDAGVTRGLADGTALTRLDAHAPHGPLVWSLAR